MHSLVHNITLDKSGMLKDNQWSANMQTAKQRFLQKYNKTIAKIFAHAEVVEMDKTYDFKSAFISLQFHHFYSSNTIKQNFKHLQKMYLINEKNIRIKQEYFLW